MKYTVIQAGYPGDSSRAMLRRMEREVLRHQPHTVVIQCGTNDALNPAARVPVDEFASNIRSMTERLASVDASVLLVTPPPVHSPEMIIRYKLPNPPGSDLNPILEKYVSAMRLTALQRKLPLLDLNYILKFAGKVGAEPESLIRNQANSRVMDGAHLTPDGYRLMAVLIYQTLLNKQIAGETVVCFGDSLTYGYPLTGMGSLEGDNYPAVLNRLLNGEE